MIIRTAIASYGMSGRVFHGPCLRVLPRYEVTAIMERTKSLSELDFPKARIVRRFDEIVADPDIDLVVVNTPNSTHYEFARAALLHGKHVVLEKPITTSVPDAEELIAIANTKNIILAPYHNRRFESGYKTVRKLIAKGTLGDVHTFRTSIDRWRPQIGKKRWKETPNEGSGLFWDLAPHLVDEALSLFGKLTLRYAEMRTQRPQSLVDDYFHLILHGGGVSVDLEASLMARLPAPCYAVYGSRGAYVKASADPQEALLAKGELPTADAWGSEVAQKWGVLVDDDGVRSVPGEPGQYLEFYRNLYDVIANGANLVIRPQDALDGLQVMVAAVELAKNAGGMIGAK